MYILHMNNLMEPIQGTGAAMAMASGEDDDLA